MLISWMLSGRDGPGRGIGLWNAGENLWSDARNIFSKPNDSLKLKVSRGLRWTVRFSEMTCWDLVGSVIFMISFMRKKPSASFDHRPRGVSYPWHKYLRLRNADP
jgi:hypothetical protein